LILLTLLHPVAGRAQQCPAHQIDQPLWHPDQDPKVISVFLLHSVRPSEQASAKWLLVDTRDGMIVPIARVEAGDYGPSSVLIKPLQPLLLDHIYYLSAEKVKFDDCATPQPEITPVVVLTKRKTAPTGASTPSTSRDDSDFYFAPTIDGASGTKAAYTLDAKLQFRKALAAPRFGRGPDPTKRAPYRPGVSFIPGIDFKISSNAKEDGNSVAFQVPVEVLTIVDPAAFPGLAKVIRAVISRPGFVAEADKKFHNVNAIFSDGEYFALRGYGSSKVQVVPEPMLGFETGSNVKAQQTGTYAGSILRANFGLRVVMTVFQPSKAKPLFSLESNYIRRLILHGEPVYAQDSKGNQILSLVGTNPRDHVDLKVTYNLTPFVGLSVGYEYGELPPVFTKVDNKYTFGITFKGQLQYKPINAK
jgi:hypothetical protein